MDVGPAIFLKIPLIAAGGYNRFILHLKNPCIILLAALGITDSHSPAAAIWLRPYSLDISAQGHHRRRNSISLKNFGQFFSCIALGNSSKINLLAFSKSYGIAAYFYRSSIHIRKKVLNLFPGWNMILPSRKAPKLHERINRIVKKAVCLLEDFFPALDNLCQII